MPKRKIKKSSKPKGLKFMKGILKKDDKNRENKT